MTFRIVSSGMIKTVDKPLFEDKYGTLTLAEIAGGQKLHVCNIFAC